ncbi:RNA polymerase sigma-70 factor, ECF subfamily [Mucilaginibacter gossypiicola]|uniref:RNA polymerase sigma-70 factor, ECF subfamily n=1 Tax=Mucilaginibacter gossypiicola TaxID=551995 RepID=A0A1H8NW62_9SPHI|nr:RNA polymerase sigma-70 factor [Mucilaginibacter gossypiicola]SEO33558.1 RNA polymerase sigma-70 factor, ECF subfamily [Mucilaginibacter gossypiicola]
MLAYTVYNDAELTDLLRSGDELAYTEIYRRYWRLMYAHIYKMLRDEEDSKDILQELFSTLWTKANKIPAQGNLAGYLYVSARNMVLNHIRQQKFRDEYLGSLAQFASEASVDTLHYLEERDLLAAIEREIEALPPKMRQVFEMSRKQNLTHKEIAESLGTSEETVKKQIHKSLKRLRVNLKDPDRAVTLLMLLSFFKKV